MVEYQEPYVLSIDVGTSSVRSKVYDGNGNEVKGIGDQIGYSMTHTAEGGDYIEADQLLEIIFRVIDKAEADAKKENRPISGVGCCTFWHNVMGIDEEGIPCTPLLSWSDTRPERILPKLCNELDPTDYTLRTGCPMHSSYLPAKITWMKWAMPEVFGRVRYWMSIGEYLYFRLFGERRCSYSMASGSGLLNSAACEWDEKTIQAIPALQEHLSILCDANERFVDLKNEYKTRWPGLNKAVWFPALGDGACSNLGCGCSSPDRFGLMVGTSGAMRVIWRGDYREPPAGLWSYRIDSSRPIQGGALSNGGNLYEWMKNTLQFKADKRLDAELRERKADGHGLTVLPFLAGQRSPRWNPNSRATIHGLHLSTRPIDIVQAGLEAIAYRFKMIHDLLLPHFHQEHIMVATGGGLLNSHAWIQIMADVMGRSVQISKVSQASCRGAALMALESLGAIEDIGNVEPHFGELYEPRKDAHTLYQVALKRHVDYEMHMRSISLE